MHLIWSTSRSLFILNATARIAKSLLPVTILWVGKEIIDTIILLSNQAGDEVYLYQLIGLELVLVLSNDLLGRAVTLTEGLLGNLYSNQSSVDIIQKAARLPLWMLEDADFYDKLERARQQTSRRVTLLSNILAQLQDLVTVGSLMVALVLFEPWLIVLLIVSIVPSFINEMKFSQEKYSLLRSWTPERRELDYYRMIGASDTTAKEIKLFGLADFIADRFAYLADKYYYLDKELTVRRSIYGAGFTLVGNLAYYGAYVVIVARVLAGLLTVGELTFLAGSFSRLRQQIEGLFTRLTRITESAMYLEDYFDFIDIEIPDDQRADYLPMPTHISTSIEVQHLSFTYPGGTTPVLDDVSFTIRAGEKMAFVGENGAGKTTLIKLLLRLYEPSSGVILIDGVDARSYRRADYQRQFGAIFQDFVKYYISAGENIAVGEIRKLKDKDSILSAAQQSLADTVIDSLPAGYEQVLGKRFKSGVELSGGQWQKIALARAYLSDSQVIILDEPTSALDARAEYEVFQRFIGLTEGRTSIIISHRFSTVRMADRILVLSGGKVAELGTHEALMHADGLYAELFALQAEGYQ